MKIEIHIKDTAPTGKRVGFRNLYLESCRVYKEPGDGLRLDNLAVAAAVAFGDKAKDFISKAKEVYK